MCSEDELEKLEKKSVTGHVYGVMLLGGSYYDDGQKSKRDQV
jgi:hypothetical protein